MCYKTQVKSSMIARSTLLVTAASTEEPAFSKISEMVVQAEGPVDQERIANASIIGMGLPLVTKGRLTRRAPVVLKEAK